MNTSEGSFECIFAQDRHKYRFHVRASGPQEAEGHIRALLRDSGLHSPGTIVIRDGDGTLLCRSEYAGENVPFPRSAANEFSKALK